MTVFNSMHWADSVHVHVPWNAFLV